MKNRFLVICILLITNAVYGQLSGTYTVGGTSPNYTDLNAAITALNQQGVSGPVIFNVRPLSYPGRVTLTDITSASSSNNITIQTEPNSSKMADFNHSSYPFYLNGAKHFVFKNLKIRTTGNSRVIYLNNNCEDITIEADSLIGAVTTSTSSAYTVIHESGTASHVQKNISINDCFIINGSNGIILAGSTTGGSFIQPNINIENNTISNFVGVGISLFNCPGSTIKNNVINDYKTGNRASTGIFAGFCDSIEISNNTIQLKFYRGINLNRCYGTSSNKVLIVNNVVQYSETSDITKENIGLRLERVEHTLIANNSVNIPSGNSASSPIWSQYGNNIRILNNSLVNKGLGYAAYIDGSTAITELDNNNLFGSGGNFAYYSPSGNLSNFSAWKTATGATKSNNSINTDPLYISHLDLRVNNYELDSAGKPLPEVTSDIENKTRNTTFPDIGAYEFKVENRDAGITKVFSSLICEGQDSVQITLRNFGYNTLNQLSIAWRVREVGSSTWLPQTSFSFIGNLAQGKDTILNLGNFIFGRGKTYQVEANTIGFNSLSDQQLANDTITSSFILPRMNGLYKVGTGTGNDWSTIDSAIKALETIGICGPTTIYIKVGNYNEYSRMNIISGVNNNDTILFLGDTSGVRPHWHSFNTLLTLNGGSYVTFRNIKMETSNSHRGIEILGNVSHFTFDNNEIIADSGLYGGTARIIMNWPTITRQAEYMRFTNNTFRHGQTVFYWQGGGVTNREKGNVFIGNKLLDVYASGFTIDDQDSLQIRDNIIEFTPHTTAFTQGIEIIHTINFDIIGNTIEMPYARNGMRILSCGASTGTVSRVMNNFISVGGTNYGSGLLLESNYNLEVFHNSVHVYSNRNDFYAFAMHSGKSIVKNNSFYNSGGGPAASLIISWTDDYQGDYNNFKTTANVPFGYYNGNINSFGAWKTASGQDTNSISVDPQYFGKNDLHSRSTYLESGGTPLGVQLDIDKEQRSQTAPDIGADEFAPILLDLAVNSMSRVRSCLGNHPITINFKNIDTTTVSSINYSWSLYNNGIQNKQRQAIWNGSLKQNDSVFINIDTLNILIGDTFEYHFRIDSVNHQLDWNQNNDSISYYILIDSIAKASLLSSFPDHCQNGPLYLLNNASGTPAGGSGKYLLDTTFITQLDPKKLNVDSHILKYVYTDTNNCIDTISQFFNVDSIPVISFLPPIRFCKNQPQIVLNNGKPAGGSFSGKSITNGRFNVSAISTTQDSIKYIFQDLNSCSDSAFFVFSIDTVPTVSFKPPYAFCENSTPVNLSNGIPGGGVYSGNGVSAGIFSPASSVVGKDSLQYSYADLNGCIDSAKYEIEILAKPTLRTQQLPTFCSYDSSTTLHFVTPKGGNYKGIGVSNDSIFNPKVSGIGAHSISYTYTASNSCMDSVINQVNVFDIPKVYLGNDTAICSKESLLLDASNTGGKYLWNTGATSQTLKITLPGSYSVRVIDANNCVNFDSIKVDSTAVCVGINDQVALNKNVAYFPNPNNGLLTLKLNGIQGQVQLLVYDMKGVEVSEFNWNIDNNIAPIDLDVQHLNPGTYIFSLRNNFEKVYHRIIIE